MSHKIDALKEAFRQIDNYESLICGLQDGIRMIAEPLFRKQAEIAYKISEEPGFAEIKTGTWQSPYWQLVGLARANGNYVYDGDELIQEQEYNDGEITWGAKLLPEFFTDDVEAQTKAVREYFKSFMSKKEREDLERRERKIEEAKKLLRANGFDV